MLFFLYPEFFPLQPWVTFPRLGSCGPVPSTSGWATVQQGLSKARVVYEVSSVTLLPAPLALFSTRALNPFQESLSGHSYLMGGRWHKCCAWDVLEVRRVKVCLISDCWQCQGFSLNIWYQNPSITCTILELLTNSFRLWRSSCSLLSGVHLFSIPYTFLYLPLNASQKLLNLWDLYVTTCYLFILLFTFF